MITSTNKLVYSDDGRLSDDWAYRLESDKTYLIGRIIEPFDVWTNDGLYHIASFRDGRLTIFEGYEWDGLTCYNDTPANMIGGLVHDLGYQLGGCPNTPFTRKEIDCWIRDLIAPRAPWDARIIYAGVCAFGWKFYGKKSNVKIIYKWNY